MKRMLIWSAAAVCLLGSACSKDETTEMPDAQQGVETERLYLSDETTEAEAASRAVFTDGYKIAWEEGDQVAIQRGTPIAVQKDGAGRWFVELPAAESYSVYYPASLCAVFTQAGVLATRVKEIQTYRAGSFDPTGMPTHADAKPGEKLVFKYMTSVVKLTLKGTDAEQVTKINLSTANLGNERFSAAGEVVTGTDGVSYIAALTGNLANSTFNYVNMTANNVALTEEGVDFYLVVFPTTFSKGFEITVTLADGREMVKKGGVGQTAARGRILAMPALRFEETDTASPVYYSTDNRNWRAWKYAADGVTPVALAYPETADHMLYFKDNAAAATPGLTLKHMQSLHDTFMVHGIVNEDPGAPLAVQPIGFDMSRATYESTTLPQYIFTRYGDATNKSNITLRFISLPKNIEVIPANAFAGDAVLRQVILPAGIKEIGARAFYFARGFTNGNDCPDEAVRATNGIYCYATIPPASIGSEAFNWCNPYFHVPAASLSAYEKVWEQFKNTALTYRAGLVGDL